MEARVGVAAPDIESEVGLAQRWLPRWMERRRRWKHRWGSGAAGPEEETWGSEGASGGAAGAVRRSRGDSQLILGPLGEQCPNNCP